MIEDDHLTANRPILVKLTKAEEIDGQIGRERAFEHVKEKNNVFFCWGEMEGVVSGFSLFP